VSDTAQGTTFDEVWARDRDTLFGHPKGLFILFFAELWERFSFYGMKALLIFYMVDYLFWRQADASEVFAWYTGLVYGTTIIGGFVADKWLGARWSVVVGGVIIATGHFLLAFEPLPFFYSGLTCIIVGTGFLKPNISTQVGSLYRSDDERRDSAFTVFYMGINLGAFVGPIVCGWLRVYYGFHYGFAAAGVGMVLGLIVYISGMKSVVARERAIAEEETTRARTTQAAAKPRKNPQHAEFERKPADLARIYRDRCIVIVVICVFAILFWVGFEQAANVMNLWADKHTNMYVFRDTAPMVEVPGLPAPGDTGGDAAGGTAPGAGGGLAGWRMTAEITQSINPLFIIIFAGVFAWLWQFLNRRGLQPSTPTKMALGVFFLSLAYGVMLMAAAAENQPSDAPLAAVPPGLSIDEDGHLYSTTTTPAGAEIRTDYGCNRLRWRNRTLYMSGVLTELDWMRALAASSSPKYRETITRLGEWSTEQSDKVRQMKLDGTMKPEEGWMVQLNVPEEVGPLDAVTGWPTMGGPGDTKQKVTWNPEMRVLVTTDTLTERDEAQLLAAGADPAFRDALTAIYRESSVYKVSISWLLAFYLVLTIGELCLSPVGLSFVTKAAPPRYAGLFMGLWFLTTGFVANFAAHTVGGQWGTMNPASYFMIFGVIGVIATVLMLLMIRVLKPMLHGIH
jgi:POT family proton-dependent oligopeptide transporter